MNGNNPSQKAVWLAIILLASVVGAVVAGVLFQMAGAAGPAVVGASGAAFMGTASLGLAAHRFMTE
ncbi:hypothetical protein [Streptomyces griseorubiginosus]|uniref:hypothetical protein n=1 Tax=Streptomyces griseorubiginosus TaxID=67304 RepID=UPI00331EC5E4